MNLHASLESALRAVEPAVTLVRERHLRRIIHFLREHGRRVPLNPALPVWADRDEVLAAAVPGLVLRDAPPRLLLVTDPNDRMLDHLPLAEALRAYWRVVFRGRVGATLAGAVPDDAAAGERLRQFPPAVVREARGVLETDHLIDHDAGDAELYRAFAAAYLELRLFAPLDVREIFPTLTDEAAADRALAADVDALRVRQETRPAGAAGAVAEAKSRIARRHARDARALDPKQRANLFAAAEVATTRGNHVRAAILRARAAVRAPVDDWQRAEAGVRAAVGELVGRLAAVFGWDADRRRRWDQALAPLVPAAADGLWPPVARCLSELQKIPADLGGELFAVDVIEWARTVGRRPVVRPLPRAKDVALIRGLRRAQRQLHRADMAEDESDPLDALIHEEIDRLNHRLRADLSPVVAAVLADAGFRPANRVEEVARDKLVAELLDRLCDRGQLRLADLRDAVSRNRLKMPDLSGPVEFVRGDPLLKADSRLARELDGVYRRGEVYLRWIQRGCSAFFGTVTGRALSLYLLMPFGLAFMTLAFGNYVVHEGEAVYHWVSKQVVSAVAVTDARIPIPEARRTPLVDDDEADDVVPPPESPPPADTRPAPPPGVTRVLTARVARVPVWAILALGAFLELVFHARAFRHLVFALLVATWAACRFLLVGVPGRILKLPAVRLLLHNVAVRWVRRRVLPSLLVAAIAAALLMIFKVPAAWALPYSAVLFVVLAIFFNTTVGLIAVDHAAEAISDAWRVVRTNLIPGLLQGIMDFFRWLGSCLESVLYAVDEWLRYREGEGRPSLVLKGALGLVWFPVAYVVRFAFYLLLEPQINPVKHFPVVTVSHKLLLPMIPTLSGTFGVSEGVVGAAVSCIPGVFGFIAWEVKENWRLYRANRGSGLGAAVVGSHGESVRGLLRPGFHSGTVPKLRRKLRKAVRAGDEAKTAHLHHELEHVAEFVHHFVSRELPPLLPAGAVTVGDVRLGCQRAEIDLALAGAARLTLAFENLDGRIAAELLGAGALDTLPPERRAALLDAVRGVFDMAMAERVDGKPRSEEGKGVWPPWAWGEWVARWQRPG